MIRWAYSKVKLFLFLNLDEARREELVVIAVDILSTQYQSRTADKERKTHAMRDLGPLGPRAPGRAIPV